MKRAGIFFLLIFSCSLFSAPDPAMGQYVHQLDHILPKSKWNQENCAYLSSLLFPKKNSTTSIPLTFSPFSTGSNEKFLISNNITTVALAKIESDHVFGKRILQSISNKNDFNNQQIGCIGAYHEVLAYALNLLLKDRFKIPACIFKDGYTYHAFRENSGKITAQDLVTTTKSQSQNLTLLSFILTCFDARSVNFLSSEEGIIPVDFARILSAYPNNINLIIKTCVFHFPYLEEPLGEKDRLIYSRINPGEIINSLNIIFKKNTPKHLIKIFHYSLARLHANLITIKYSAKHNLNPIQVSKLFLFEIKEDEHNFLLKTYLENPFFTSDLTPQQQQTRNFLKKHQFLSQSAVNNAFEKAYLNNEFDPLLYTLLIQRSIIKLNSDSSSKRYHKRALFWLHKAKILSPL